MNKENELMSYLKCNIDMMKLLCNYEINQLELSYNGFLRV